MSDRTAVAPRVTMNDFTREPAALREAELAAVGRVLDSGWFILGPEVTAFERAWEAYTGVAHAVGVANGLDAIEVGLRALGIGAGDEVITTPMSAFATVLGILRAGATPVLADIDPDTALLDVESAARCITPRTRAIMPVHLYGQLRNMSAWRALCAERGVTLVEDCAQSHGAREDGVPAGAFGAWGAYSFYPTKNLGAAGDAGALVTRDAEVAARVASLRNYGQSERYHHPLIGMNSRLDEIHAAMLLERLRYLDAFTQRRREIAAVYHARLRNPLVIPLAPPTEPEAHVYHLFVLRTPERERLQAHLAGRGVQTLIHYPVPIHDQPPCRDLRRDPRGLAASDRHAAECLSIPCHPQMDESDVDAVVAAINDFR